MRRCRDVFRVRKCRRIYDRAHDRFSFHVEYETHAELTERTVEVAEAFGLGIDDAQKFPVLNAELQISPKDIVYITGDSGSDKSVLLHVIREAFGALRHKKGETVKDYQVELEKADFEKLARLIRVVGRFYRQRFTCFGSIQMIESSVSVLRKRLRII